VCELFHFGALILDGLPVTGNAKIDGGAHAPSCAFDYAERDKGLQKARKEK
jgi:hypothetical protein